MSEIPAVLRRQMRDYASDACDIDGQFAWSGARYVINDYYLMWQIPCFQGAYQGSGVFAVTQNPPQDWGELLTLPNPPGLEGNQNYSAMNAKVLGPPGHIETTEFGRGAGDCGVYQVFRLIDGPGEVLELELLEYREKIDCDGKVSDPTPGLWPTRHNSSVCGRRGKTGRFGQARQHNMREVRALAGLGTWYETGRIDFNTGKFPVHFRTGEFTHGPQNVLVDDAAKIKGFQRPVLENFVSARP